ncbi:hypothetical protein FOZ63_018994 [Perkinsus olseni]|uniref:Uncharacterized protein n=1 Tax=Perkinsus olseni TaxID=32597 RepID=A0A7J6N7A5_PEROL|nr:hypothetical protein FOZ63_018994 [Perkinsus olseni]
MAAATSRSSPTPPGNDGGKDDEENDERYRALNDEYHTSKYLESIGVTPTARRCKMMLRLQHRHREYGTPPRDGIEEGQGNNISSRRDSANIPRQQYTSHTDTSSSSSSAAAEAEAEAVVSSLLDKKGLPPLVMSDASPSPILLPNIPLHGFNEGEAAGGAPQEDSMKDGNKLNELPVDRAIMHELENLRHQQQRQEQARRPRGEGMIQTTQAEMGCEDGMSGSVERLQTAGNDGNDSDDDDDDAQFCRLIRRFVWPFAYLDYESSSSSSSSSHHRSIRQEYVWGGFESSSGVSMERELDSTLLKGIVRQKRIGITIPQVEDYITHYITNTYPIPLLRGDIPTRGGLVSGVGDDEHLPPRLVEQFRRLCKECELARLGGLLAHLAYWLMFGGSLSSRMDGEDTHTKGLEGDEGISALPEEHRQALVLTILHQWSRVLSNLPRICSVRGHQQRQAYWLRRCILLLKVCVRWIILEYQYPALLSLSNSMEGKVNVRINAMFKVLFDPDMTLSRFPHLERPSAGMIDKDLIRMAREADAKATAASSTLPPDCRGKRQGKRSQIPTSRLSTAAPPPAAHCNTALLSHQAAEAETRPCSTSPSREDRHRVRTRSELTEADDSDVIFNSNGADEQEDAMNTAGSPLQTSNDGMMIQPGQPLGKRPRLSKSPLHSKAIGTASPTLVEGSVIGAHPQPDKVPSNGNDALSLRDEGCHGDRATSELSSEGDNEHELLTSPAGLTSCSGNMSFELSPSRDVKIAKNIDSKRKSGDRRLPAPEVCLLPTTAEGCPMTEDACIAGLWKSIGWEVELHYDCESGKVWGRWGPLQAITAYLSGDRLVDGILELGGIELTEAVVDLQGGTIHWGTGERWTRLPAV